MCLWVGHMRCWILMQEFSHSHLSLFITASDGTVVETFEGHNLPYSYWTDDLICKHDVTFTKHKKYTFCSQYKTSSKSSPYCACRLWLKFMVIVNLAVKWAICQSNEILRYFIVQSDQIHESIYPLIYLSLLCCFGK